MVQPKYPPMAKDSHVEGTVVLHAIILKDGSVGSLEVISGPALLRQSALDAVRQWLYYPTELNGTPVEVDTTICVIYRLS
jgi:protein TonB